MSDGNHIPSVEDSLLGKPRRVAGLDSCGEPVRLGEVGADGLMAGYIDESGLAWSSLTEYLVATSGGRLAEALQLNADDPRRDQLIEAALSKVPDELIADVAQEAAGILWLRSRRRE